MRERLGLFILAASIITATCAAPIYAQSDKNTFAPINTAVPSLSIAPDARAGAMGDNGASTTPDIASQFWNPAKYPFHYSNAGIGMSYTPWLRRLVNDVALAYLSGFYKIGEGDKQAVSGSLRYFTLGEILQTYPGESIPYNRLNPYEMAVDISYSRKLSELYSMAVTARYIRSDMSDQSDEMMPGSSVAADVSGYIEKYIITGRAESLWSFGYHISNIGTKISYDGGATNEFIPTTLRIGTGLLYPLDDFNRIGVYVDVGKFLVPSLPKARGTTEEEQAEYDRLREEYNTMSFMTGIFRSFHDAPGGLSEELKEVNISLGVEYGYNEQFFLRGGYYYENPYKGNRQYFSFGAGFRMSVFQLDAAYLVSTVPSNPLDQTLRFSLSFDMDGIKNLIR
ncbi:MAG: type IX secretion system outer membrane channel protein PorV [Tannerellaceae bacterium]|jgi:hypothetical protein|nr:type IX secretion system outer membrane channel protein PorV [Tannerellaceae bacterium]